LEKIISKEKLDRQCYAVQTKEESVFIHCKPCGADIMAGPVHKNLQYFKSHIKRSSHHQNVTKYHDRLLRKRLHQERLQHHDESEAEEKRLKLAKEKCQLEIRSRFSEIDKKYKGVFELKEEELELRADPSGPSVPKGHKKQTNIWERGNPKPDQPPNLQDFPRDEEMEVAWQHGIEDAQKICRDLGKSNFTHSSFVRS
jgi:hypothetical protein